MKTKEKEKRSIKKELISWAQTIVAAVVIAVFINSALIVNAEVPSGSMESTISVGDRIIGNRLAYLFSEPERGDVILFPFPDDGKTLYIKRVIGLPGETVRIIDGKVYIDGADEPLSEPYLGEALKGEAPMGSFGPYTVPETCYFVMGDNRNNSHDSRYWVHPYVPRDTIKAKADFCYYPKPYALD